MLSLRYRKLNISDFKKSDLLVETTHSNQTQTALFSFYERDGRPVQHYFLLSCDEISVLGLRFFQLRIQPLRQGQPSQIVASWFLEIFKFRSVLVNNCFKKNEVNLLSIIKGSIHDGLNLSEFARELVPIKFDITMHTDSPWPDSSEDDDALRRGFNPIRCSIKASLNLQRKRPLCIEYVAAFEVSDDERNPKKR